MAGDPDYLQIRDTAVECTSHVTASLLVDFDAAGEIVGVEKLDGPVDFEALKEVLEYAPIALRRRPEAVTSDGQA